MTEDMDQTDIKLLRRIEKNYEINLKDLSDELDMSKSAIHYRLKKLKENGVIKQVAALPDPMSFGLNMIAITDVFVKHETGYAEEVGEELADVPGVSKVYYTMGDVDFMIISRVQDRDQLTDLINSIVAIDRVDKTSSTFVLDEMKNDHEVVSNLSSKMVDNILKPD